MKSWTKYAIICIILTAAFAAFFFYYPRDRTIRSSFSVADIMASADTVGYSRADSQRIFDFPADHGPHPGFRNEWWYFTGNLAAVSNRRFGFQFTIFRSALAPHLKERSSAWAADQAYMAHFTVTDVESNNFYVHERFSRGAAGLAGATADPFRIWLEDWEITGRSDMPDAAIPVMHLHAGENGIELELRLTPIKKIVLQGENGLSRKGSGAGNASYYYTIPRFRAEGEIRIFDTSYPVTGQVWLDREWSSSALDSNQVGWDWFSLQLNDGNEIMYYQIRESDGSAGEYSEGVFIAKDGNHERLKPADIEIRILDQWETDDGVSYPSKWRLIIPDYRTDLVITPLVDDQELNVTVRYWEGAVAVSGTSEGHGYVELTGYADAQRNRGSQYSRNFNPGNP
jgi:predicted secreted hydrolase